MTATWPVTTSAREVEGAIADAYRRLGYSLGWTFLSCPEDRLGSARVGLIGLNPAGEELGEYGEVWHVPEGNDYEVGVWRAAAGDAPLQRQVQALCRAVDTPIAELLSGQLVPFRSPSWSRLAHAQEALELSRRLWRWVLDNSALRLCFTLGHVAGEEIARLSGARLIDVQPVEWGRQQLRVYDGGDGPRIVSLPHLSRFQLFSGDRAALRASIIRRAAGLP